MYNLKFENYVREIYLNSDTSVSVLSGAPFDDSSWEFLTNEAIAEAVQMVNATAGSTRMLGHAVVRPGQPGWMDEVDKAIEERPPASWKLYTIGIGAARILGIDDRVGSLEVGKDGDLSLYDGDPFEWTSHCVGVVIEGQVMSDTAR